MTYYLTVILICLFAILWLFALVSSLLTETVGIIGILILTCVLYIIIKLAYEKYRNKEDNYYDDHVNK